MKTCFPREREVSEKMKRKAEVVTEELEKEMRDGGEEIVDSLLDLAWVDSGENVLLSFQIPELD